LRINKFFTAIYTATSAIYTATYTATLTDIYTVITDMCINIVLTLRVVYLLHGHLLLAENQSV
jgi:hypothetical protein